MKVTSVTITYHEARSARFQKVEHSVSLTVELSDGETVRDAINRYRPSLKETVTTFTGEEIYRLANEMDVMTDGQQEGRRGR
jgi:hypothetical protein